MTAAMQRAIEPVRQLMSVLPESKLAAWLLVISACLMSTSDLLHTGLQIAHAVGEVVDQVEDEEVRHSRAEARRLQEKQAEIAAPAPAVGVESVALPGHAPCACMPVATTTTAPPPLIRAPPSAAVS